MASLPPMHRALVQREYAKPLTIENIPTPKPTPGSVVIKVIASSVLSYMGDIYNGNRKYAYPTPIVPGNSAVGRVAALGPDATLLQLDQLVFFDGVIHGRDDPTAIFLSGIAEGGSEGSRKLMRGEWRDSSYAEFMKVPLENCYPLDESVLCKPTQSGGLGYDAERLSYLMTLLTPYGGLRDMRLEAGETVIISPATGSFGGAAVLVALAMGARVIAMGRNAAALSNLRALSRRVETVPITGNEEEELTALQNLGPADAFLDISPPEASRSTHIKSAILALKPGGRASLMSGFLEDIPIPYRIIMRKDIKLLGKWMYSREDVGKLIKMIEIGVLGLGQESGVSVVGSFPLEQWEEAFQKAAENVAAGKLVVLKP